ncbi:NRDE family protein [Leptothrix discophora]|uniref:NRDE family protein n=1 Tax=Leptothrix discophora TaxID=89 RepID=A0ABT9FZH0_LEPDI|nr:NRDE family protein [Leptothrix discophora]MDP4299565.1 NRDE family protein [Leptothrix discophora]
MCLVAWSIEQHARFPLVLASNRDEFHERPTAGLAWWPAQADGRQILAGRDLQAGGTWLGLGSRGRLAWLTNIRAPDPQRPDAPTRGMIVPEWLDSPLAPEELWVRTAMAGHNGFNLVALDLVRGRGHWMASDMTSPQRLEAGLYGLSNGHLDEPWPKVVALREAVDAAIAASVAQGTPREHLAERLLAALQRRERAPDEHLPATGVPLEIERGLSSVFIDMPERLYGTRSSTVLVVERVNDGHRSRFETTLIERSIGRAGYPPVRRRVVLSDWPPMPASHPLLEPLGKDRPPAGPGSVPGDRHVVELQAETGTAAAPVTTP